MLRALARHHQSTDALATPDAAAAAERARADIADIESRLHETFAPITIDASTTTADRRGFVFDAGGSGPARPPSPDELWRRVSSAAAPACATEDELRAAEEDVREMTRRGSKR